VFVCRTPARLYKPEVTRFDPGTLHRLTKPKAAYELRFCAEALLARLAPAD